MTEPSRHIPLGDDEFALLGRLTAVLAIVDDDTVECVRILTGDDSARVFLTKNSGTRRGYAKWAKIVSAAKPSAAAEASGLADRSRELLEDRNVFVHGIFEQIGGDFDRAFHDPEFYETGEGRVRNLRYGDERDIGDLPAILDRACQLSIEVDAFTRDLSLGDAGDDQPRAAIRAW